MWAYLGYCSFSSLCCCCCVVAWTPPHYLVQAKRANHDANSFNRVPFAQLVNGFIFGENIDGGGAVAIVSHCFGYVLASTKLVDSGALAVRIIYIFIIRTMNRKHIVSVVYKGKRTSSNIDSNIRNINMNHFIFTWSFHFDILVFFDNHYADPFQSSHSESIYALQYFFFSTHLPQQVRAVMEQKWHKITTTSKPWMNFIQESRMERDT